jgi:signal transduction histidine kinase
LKVLEKEKIELENLIRERTEEVVNQKSELEKQSEELSSKNDQLEKIDLIVQSINSKINFTNLFQTVLAQLKIIRNLESASALIFNKETSNFKFKAHFELIDNVSLSDVQLTLGQAENRYLYNAVEVYEDIYFKNDIEFDKLNNQLDKMTVPKSMVTIVIKVEQKTEGFIILENYTRINAFDQSDFNMIKNLKEHLIAAYIKTKILENLEETLTNLKVTQEELIRQERLVSVGQLTKGIVDRILNPLNYINNFSESSTILIDEVVEMFSKHEASISPEIKDDFAAMLGMIKNSVTKIYEHGNNTTRIVKDMQKLLKEKSKDFIETNLNSFVESRANITFDELKALYKNFEIKIEFDLVQENAKVYILPPELGDVISEIIDNSFYILNEKYNIDKSFTPKIDVSTLLFENNVVLKFRDNGKGIPPRDLQQIFSPFFTTKPTSKGSGLGLFMSKDIIELHKGKINIYSQEGIFTEITIQLPTIINPILTS